MLLERYYDEALAQASYLIGCERTGDAIVIDPNVMERYAARASHQRLRIRYVTETHIHADFVSGSRDVAREVGAQLLLSGHGEGEWHYRNTRDATLVHERQSIDVGRVRLEVFHTPGHTPEHVCFLVSDTTVSDLPMGMVSGDFLFVGDVGRPDLLERAAKVSGSMHRAARQLYASLQRLKDLPDYLQIWPGHGAGSACGKSLGALPQSTLGYERLYNPAFQPKSEAAFVKWVLADQPEPPPYFATMKRWNRDGHSAAQPDSFAEMNAKSVLAAIERGDQVVDTRPPSEFARKHIPGTINLPASRSSATYAGTVLSYEKPIVLIGEEFSRRLSVRSQLLMIGLRPTGYAKPNVIEEIGRAGHELASLNMIAAEALASDADHAHVIDVRNQSEWNHGHVPKATHIYLGDLLEKSATLKRDKRIVVHCQTGTRASIAASLLQARGFANVSTLTGGFDAWRKAGLPVAKDKS